MSTTRFVSIPSEGQPAIVRLDSPQHLACQSCGVQVAPPHQPADIEHFDTFSRFVQGLDVQDIKAGHRVDLTICADCLAIRERARVLLDEHPMVGSQIGGYSVALHRVESALVGLDALELTRRFAVLSSDELRQLIEHMAGPGVTARWARRFVPVLGAESVAETCASSRWAHLTDDLRGILQKGAAALMNARIEQPEPFGPPRGSIHRGCILCGIESIVSLPSKSGLLWTEQEVSPQVVGGAPGTGWIRGYTCVVCSKAVTDAGSIGATAMERSIIRHLSVVQRSMARAELVGVVAWAVTGVAPNEQPWEHLGDLEFVRLVLEG